MAKILAANLFDVLQEFLTVRSLNSGWVSRCGYRTAIVFLSLVAAMPMMAQEPPHPPARVVFAAMGDVPYEGNEFPLIRSQLEQLPAKVEFVVHVGDIKRGFFPCLDNYYAHVAKTLKTSKPPLFIIPGDNEYNDCLRPAHGWRLWRKHFLRFDQNWRHDFRVFRQLEREENFLLVHGGVLFIGINLVGGRVHDANEWRERIDDNVNWTRRAFEVFGKQAKCAVVFAHAFADGPRVKYNDAFTALAGEYDKPMLYLQGDGHQWIKDHSFGKAPNILRVQVDRGGVAPPVVVTVLPENKQPFVFERGQPASPPTPSPKSSP